MKPSLIFILFTFFIGSDAFTQTKAKPLPANVVLSGAYSKAAKEHKKVLLIFHASWCGWCRKMEASLNDATVKPLIDKNYVTAYLDVLENIKDKSLENAGAVDSLTHYDGKDSGLPFWTVLDKNRNVLAKSEDKLGGNIGCPASEAEVRAFIQILKQTSLLSEGELKLIAVRFRRNEE